MTAREAIERVAAMGARPRLWASSREGYGLQLVLLVEIATGPLFDRDRAMDAVFGPGPSIEGPFDVDWARRAASSAVSVIAAAERETRAGR